jgi:LysM repeat protein
MMRTKLMRTKLMRTRSIAAVLAVLLIATSVSTARAQQPGAVHGRAYLFYGLVAMIDWGMDQLAARINRTGVLATTNGHMTWRSVADQAIADYRRDPKPISVVGHSAGGDSAVQFAEALAAAHVPVALLITYDPNRTAGSIPANVERYIDLFQSSNILGGGDLPAGHGFHGHYASFNLNNRSEIIHVNMDKFDGIQAQLAAKIRSAAAGGGETVPLHVVFPSTGPIELWDSGVPVQARAGDTVQSLATAYHVPAWAVAQINQKAENASLSEGQRVVIPRYLGQKLAMRSGSPETSSPTPSAAPAANSESGSNAAPAANAESNSASGSSPSDATGSASAPSDASNPQSGSAPSSALSSAPSAASSSAAAASSAPSPAPSPASSAASNPAAINQ